MAYYLYILECSNGAYYTGYTTDLERRYAEHIEGSPKCKYTRSFPPKRLAASWELDVDLSMILRLEAAVKQLSKQKKTALIARPEVLMELVSSSTGSPRSTSRTTEGEDVLVDSKSE